MCPKAFTGGPCSLGLADNFAILGLKGANLIISEGATKIIGDVGAGPMDTGTLLKSTVQGNLFIDPTATLDIHSDFKVTGNVTSKDLSPEVADALAASACAANLPTTQSLGDITTATTITGNGGLNVIAVESVDIVKETLTISGGPNDIFIFNVAGDFIFNGSQMVLSGGVMANHILWNFPTAGSDILFFKPVAVANGTFLAPLRSYIQDHGQLNGAVIGGWGQVVLSGGGGGTGCCKAIVDGTLLAPNRTPLARPRERAGDFGPGHQHRVRVQRALPVPDAVTRVTGRGV